MKGFTCVSLVSREIQISYVDELRRALIPVVVVNSPTEELFAGVRSPVLMRISYNNRYILQREVKGFSDFSFDIPLYNRLVPCCAICYKTSLDLIITAAHFAVSERIVTMTPSKKIILALKDDQARE